ncbi:MAG: rhomboid family intramembrane serine protease [Planctomycetes bacterium]|nr:rhomboid family intramembrane serine protease [Planctomycetota bacterium]
MSSRPNTLLEAAPITCANLAGCICFFVFLAIASANAQALAGGRGGIMNLDGETLLRYGASMREGLWGGDWQRLVLPIFMHGGLMHIVMNMVTLWYFGPPAELHFGPPNFGTIYFMSGIGGVCLSMLFGGRLSVGASGALFGIMGAHLAVELIACARLSRAWKNSAVRREAFVIAILYFVLMLDGHTDNWGHLGGLIFGVLYGMLFEFWRKHSRVGLALILALVAFSVSLIVAARWTVWDPYYHVYLGLKAEDAGQTEEARARYEAARDWARYMRSHAAGEKLLERGQAALHSNQPEAAERLLDMVEAIGDERQVDEAHWIRMSKGMEAMKEVPSSQNDSGPGRPDKGEQEDNSKEIKADTHK